AGELLSREPVAPGGELVGPGLDGIDILPGFDGRESGGPAVVAMMDHRFTPPVPVLLAAPDQCGTDRGVSATIDVGPDLDPLARNPLHGKAAAIDQRIDAFDQKSAACCGSFDGLNCLVHGDAIDKKAGA